MRRPSYAYSQAGSPWNNAASLSGLISGHTWYGITPSSAAAALADKHAQFFSGANCANGACSIVRVWTTVDEGQLKYEALKP